MAVFVALLRAVNVGGTGRLLMSDLRDLCAACGFENAQTFIQSGNVVFRSALREASVKARLEKALAARSGKPVAVLVRSAGELAAVARKSPFSGAVPSKVVVYFLNDAPERGILEAIEIPGREELELRGRELFVHYPDGIGRSKLKLPLAQAGTGRNLATVRKLAALAEALDRE